MVNATLESLFQRVGLNLFLFCPSIAAALVRHGRMTSSGLLPPLIP